MIYSAAGMQIESTGSSIRISEKDPSLSQTLIRIVWSLPWIAIGLICIVGLSGMKPTPGKEVGAVAMTLLFITFMGLMPLYVGLRDLLLRESYFFAVKTNEFRRNWLLFGKLPVSCKTLNSDTLILRDYSRSGLFIRTNGYALALSGGKRSDNLVFFDDLAEADGLAKMLSSALGLAYQSEASAKSFPD